MKEPLTTGKVKFYNEKKGYGFIVQDGQGNELFFHATECVSHAPKEGEAVEFYVGDGKRGPCAKGVTRLK